MAARSAARASTNSSPSVGGVLSRTSVSGTDSFEPEYVRLRRPVDGRRWVLDRPSFLRIFVEDERAVRWKIPDYGLSNGIALVCKAIYGWEFPHLFRGTPTKLPDLEEILPEFPTYVRRARSKGFVLTPEAFKAAFVDSNFTQGEAKAEFGISHQAMIWAVKHYKEFAPALLKKRGRMISARRIAAEAFFPQAKLERLLARGLTVEEIAAELGVGASLVLIDLRHHGIARSRGNVSQWLDSLSQPELDALALVNQEMGALTGDAAHDFPVLLETYQRLMALADIVKLSKATLRALQSRGELPKAALTFSSNRAEMRLSRTLTAAGIEHTRLFAFFKNWQADFAWPEKKLMVEVDGEYHRKDAETKKRDARKTKKARQLGYRVLRFTIEQVDGELPMVIHKIAEVLGHELPPSLQQA